MKNKPTIISSTSNNKNQNITNKSINNNNNKIETIPKQQFFQHEKFLIADYRP